MKLEYAHQVRPETDPLPFEMRTVDVKVRKYPPDYQFNDVDSYQVFLGIRAISDDEITVRQAMVDAAINLMWESRGAYTAAQLLGVLVPALPEWHFTEYGHRGAVVGYPPHNRSANTDGLYQNWSELSAHAYISSHVSGNGYVVTTLKEKP